MEPTAWMVGKTESAIARVATGALETVAVAVAVLAPPVVAVALAESVRAVPFAVPALTVTAIANVPVNPTGKPVDEVQVTVPPDGPLQLHVTAPTLGGVIEI